MPTCSGTNLNMKLEALRPDAMQQTHEMSYAAVAGETLYYRIGNNSFYSAQFALSSNHDQSR